MRFTRAEKRRRKEKRTGAANGFSLPGALLVFLELILVISLLCLQCKSRYWLMKAAAETEMEIQILDEAKSMASQSAWRQRCFSESESTQSAKTQTVKDLCGQSVVFTDNGHCIDCFWSAAGNPAHLQLFYDTAGIVSIEISSQKEGE